MGRNVAAILRDIRKVSSPRSILSAPLPTNHRHFRHPNPGSSTATPVYPEDLSQPEPMASRLPSASLPDSAITAFSGLPYPCCFSEGRRSLLVASTRHLGSVYTNPENALAARRNGCLSRLATGAGIGGYDAFRTRICGGKKSRQSISSYASGQHGHPQISSTQQQYQRNDQ